MRLALTGISWHLPGPERPEQLGIAYRAIVDEIVSCGGDWPAIVDELLGVLQCALLDVFHKPVPNVGVGRVYVVNTASVTQWLADHLDSELDEIEHGHER
jgi:hypothetical protein